MINDVNPLRFCLDLASSDVNIFLLSFHCGWMIWGVGAGRKLLKCCGNCCNSERDAGLLLFVKDMVGMLRVRYDPPACLWSIVYASLVSLPRVLSSDELDPTIGVVNLDKFKGSFSICCIKVVPSIRVSWSLIFKVDVYFDMCWEIVLLSPEDLCELVTECFVCLGHHGGNSSVFQELVGKPNLC